MTIDVLKNDLKAAACEMLLRINRSPMIFGPKYVSRLRNYWSTDSCKLVMAVANKALVTVPYYRRQRPVARVGNIGEFKATFATIDKDVVLANFQDFIADDINFARYDLCTTGGTSGKPMKLVLPKDRYVHEFSALHNVWAQVGYQFSPRAVVRNQRLEGRDFVVNPVLREYVFDGFRSTDEYLGRIYDVMKSRRIGFYHGYTSNAHEFARFLARERLDHSFLNAFITTSENFYAHQKAAFDALDGVRHVNFYGHSEKLVLAAYCSLSGRYHFHQQYGFCELLDEDGDDVSEVGQIGEITGSTIYNLGMPLLRYRTGDFARFAGFGKCLHCGHDGMSASEILGRWQGDRVYNLDGSYITTTALNLHSDLYARIQGLQYVQVRHGELIVRVVPGDGFNDLIAARLRADVVSKMAPNSTVIVEQVSELERSSNGKFLLLVSRFGSGSAGVE